MWQRFTERARKAVFYAQEEALNFGEGYVSTEHLLLALLRDPDSVAARVLTQLGLDLQRLRVEIEKQLGKGTASPNHDMTLTPRAKRVVDLAFDEAREVNNNYLGTEHLLLGLIREAEGVAGRTLENFGVTLSSARAAVALLQSSDSKRIGAEVKSAGWTQTVIAAGDRPAANEPKMSLRASDRTLIEILGAEGGCARRILAGAGIDVGSLESTIRTFGELHPYDEPSAYNAEWGKLMILCDAEKRVMDFARIGTQHLLVAVLDLGLGCGAEALATDQLSSAMARKLAQSVEGED